MKKQTKLIVILVVVLILAGLAGYLFSNKDQLFSSNDEKIITDLNEFTASVETIDRSKVIIIGSETSYAPVAFTTTDGKQTGFDIDLAREVIKTMGKEVIFKPLDFSKKEEMINSGEIDLIWSGMSINEERKNQFEFSNPYFEESEIVIVNKQSYIRTLDDLAGTTVGVQKGSNNFDKAKSFKTSDNKTISSIIDHYTEGSQAISGLLSGEVDAVFTAKSVASYYASRTPDTFIILDETFGKYSNGVAAKKGRTELVSEVNAGLEKVKSSGKYDELIIKWFGK